MHSFVVICANIAISHILAKTRFTGLLQNNGHYAIDDHSRSLILVSIESPHATSC